MTVNVAVAQFGATTDKERNRRVIAGLVADSAAAGAQLVVLPENAMYSNPDASADISAERETLDGPFASFLSDLGRQHQVAIVAGMTEVIPDTSKASNTLIAVDAAGSQIGIYRKVHLYDAFGYRESDRVESAEFVPTVLTIGDVRFGLATCYDLRFPEQARALVDAGAQALVYPAAWVAGPAKEFHWTTLLLARAIENTSYVIGAGMSGPACTGQSAIIDPMGVTVACAGEEVGIAVGPVSVERVDAVRVKNPSLANRRFSISAGLAPLS